MSDFPALLEQILDPDQMQAIMQDANAVVSAGAGSGKTTVLSYRFLRLVYQQKAAVDEILTLTFTRKAAAEMHARIHALLVRNSHVEGIMRQLQAFDSATIATLDSFCTAIVRADSMRYGIPPDFLQDDEQCRVIAGETAERILFSESPQQWEGLHALVMLHSVTRVKDEIMTPFALNHSGLDGSRSVAEDAGRQRASLEERYTEHLSSLRRACTAILEQDASAGVQVQRAQAGCRMILDEPVLESADWAAVEEYLSRAPAWRKPSGKSSALVIAGEATEQIREHLACMALVAGMLAGSGMHTLVMKELSRYRDAYLARKQLAKVLTFSDVATLAVKILRENTMLRNRYKQAFRYIMIDEFQDNNDLQRQLLFLLAERLDGTSDGIPAAGELVCDKLFFVGDEKQSIYRFRGADVSVFKRLKEDITAMGGRALSLRYNYRSTPQLIAAFNAIFPAILTGNRDYEAEFSPLQAGRQPVEPEAAPPVTLMTVPRAEDVSDSDMVTGVDAEAVYIARYISRAVADPDITVGEGDGRRSAGYSDFALLLRSTSNQMRFELALRREGVPYTVHAARALFLEAPVNDIFFFLQLVIYPDDRRSYAAVLRSPFVQLGDADILRLLAAFDGRPFLSVEGAFSSPRAEKAYAAAAALFNEVSSAADTLPLSGVIQLLWYRGGYRWYLLRNPDNHAFLEYYSYLIGLAKRADEQGLSLSRFLDELRPHIGHSEKTDEIELFPVDPPGVQILTIHKSKGLEFPFVIIPDAGNSGRSLQEPLLYAGKEGVTVSCTARRQMPGNSGSANYFFYRDRELAVDRERAELKRLLYVAMTRAERHLMITGCWTRRNSGEAGSRNSFLGMLEAVLGSGNEERLAALVQRGEIPPVAETWSGSRESRLAEVERMRKAFDAARIIAYDSQYKVRAATALHAEQPLSRSDGLSLAENLLPSLEVDDWLPAEKAPGFGTLVHAVLEQRLRHLPAEQAPLPELLQDMPEREGQLRSCAEDAVAALLESPAVEKLLQDPDALVETEVPFLLLREGDGIKHRIRGKIDILITFPEKIVILDVKSDRYRLPEEHSQQLALYREAAAAFSGKDVSGGVVYLRDPEVIAWMP